MSTNPLSDEHPAGVDQSQGVDDCSDGAHAPQWTEGMYFNPEGDGIGEGKEDYYADEWGYEDEEEVEEMCAPTSVLNRIHLSEANLEAKTERSAPLLLLVLVFVLVTLWWPPYA
eukprot:SAG11_NODE_22898_length_398_cov_1.110368_1_plen_114_part_10